MMGDHRDTEEAGIIPRMTNALFHRIRAEKVETKKFLVQCSYFEIYNEVVYDLLDPTRRAACKAGGTALEIREDKALGVFVKGLQEIVVDSEEKIRALMEQGASVRSAASTNMNAHSSRSHSIFSIKVHQKDAASNSNIFAKINLVDLAGSERVAKSGATGKQLTEGVNINKSLSALGNVINALAESAKTGKAIFVPFRNSKLTRVLQESLGGNSLTSMLATVSPAESNLEETFSTLKYADRAKAIRLKAVKNEEIGQIEKLEREIKSLKSKLADHSHPVDLASENRYLKQIAEYESFMKQTWEDKEAMSQEHERERERIIINNRQQQQALARKVADEQQRRWKLLTEKDDVLLTIRDLALDQLEEYLMHSWVRLVEEAARLEEDADTQHKLVQLHQTDFEACVRHWASQAGDETHPALTAALSSQLRGKLSVLIAEAQNAQRAQSMAVEASNGAEKSVAVAIAQIAVECGDDMDGSTPSTPKSARSLVLRTPEEQQDGLALVQQQLRARAKRMQARFLAMAPASIPVELGTATTIMAVAGRIGDSRSEIHVEELIGQLQKAIRRLQHTQCFIAPSASINLQATQPSGSQGKSGRSGSRGKSRPDSGGSARPASGGRQPHATPVVIEAKEAGVVRSGMELADAVARVLEMCADMAQDTVKRQKELDSNTLSRTEERVRKLKQENEKLRADLLSASTALQSASTTINSQSSKLQELKKVHKRSLREQEVSQEQQRIEAEAHALVVRDLSSKLETMGYRHVNGDHISTGENNCDSMEVVGLRDALSVAHLERDTAMEEVMTLKQDCQSALARQGEKEDAWQKERDALEESLNRLENKLEEEERAAKSASTAKSERLAAAEAELGEALKRGIAVEALNAELKAKLQSLQGSGGGVEGSESDVSTEIIRLRAELSRSEEKRAITEERRKGAEKNARQCQLQLADLEIDMQGMQEEREEDQQQFAVLIEERDNAREKEEEYFLLLQELESHNSFRGHVRENNLRSHPVDYRQKAARRCEL